MIVVLTQCFPSRIGGIETLISNLSLSLSKENKVIVFADRHNLFFDSIYDNQVKNNFLVRRIGGLKFFRRRRKVKELKAFISSGKIECVIADSWKSLELTIDLLNDNKIPTICLAHGNELIQTNLNKNKKIFKTLDNCTSVIANSEFTLKLLTKFNLHKTLLNKIYPGVSDLKNIKEKKISTITGSPIVLTLARLEKRKGHINVIKSIKLLKNEFKNIQYVIAGTGPELKNLKKEVKNSELEKNVIFLGNINDSEKKFIFSKTNLLVMPTIDESEKKSIEGFGIVYLESALYGIPSIASNVGGTPEAVLHNKTGIIINKIDELENTIKELLINNEKRNFLGSQAKKRAIEKFNWDDVSKEYINLIKNMKKD